MRWSEVTAVFGGTFDPPHVGHREAVSGLLKDLALPRVLVIPTPAPPHKPTQASTEQRVEMTRLTFAGLAGAELDLRETRRPTSGPAYTFDTLTDLRPQFPQLAFVIGADQLARLHTWHRFPEILGQCHWIVLERKPHGSDEARSVLRDWSASGLIRPERESNLWKLMGGKGFLRLLPTDAPDLSSTRIREEIARSGRPPAGSLLPAVEAYLMQYAIYGMPRRPL